MTRFIFAAAVLLSGCSWFSGSQEPAAGPEKVGIGQCQALFLEEKYSDAFSCCSGLDDPGALYNVAWMYARGKGTEPNLMKSRILMERSAAGGYTDAMLDLGRMYDLGAGGVQNYEKAFYWYSRAAERNNVSAMNSLSSLYYCGDGVEQNYSRSLLWSRRAAALNSAEGMFNVGKILDEKKVKDPDISPSDPMYWYQKAAELKYPEAVFIIAKRNYEKKAQKEHLLEIKRAALLGSPSAALYMGNLARRGVPDLDNKSKSLVAYCWYSLGESLGSAEAVRLKKKLTSGWSGSRLLEAEEQCGD
jgi:hypothetical protein